MKTQEVDMPTFLFIDDDAAIREVLDMASTYDFPEEGIIMRTAKDGKTAIDMLDTIARDPQKRIDGIFLDVSLTGGMSSLVLLQWIRGHERLGGTRITICTGFDTSVLPGELVGLPRLSKPFNISSLVETAKAMLRPE